MLRTSLLRASGLAAPARRTLLPSSHAAFAQARSAHAISNPTLADIEKRWEEMPPQEQADLWMALRDRMKTDWHELTAHEKKAAYFIAFGPHGPRAEAEPGENWKVFRYTMYGVIASAALFGFTRLFAGPAPPTMSQEWQEATNEYMKAGKMEPITGVSSEGYKGKGMVQSKPSGKKLEELVDDE
ncbi:cytochrome c oxidase subunit 5 [Trichodelitschia bisporula]|uniref:Cytochrome c oxidase polypeptide V n=1 Tax=Trichodelitschia bisporula TaxID=703511 RepID=A0A6G1HQ92_9PEZI|nr:cytochrome c oxidase subunit 5 [Trichodelitschia bisporula]